MSAGEARRRWSMWPGRRVAEGPASSPEGRIVPAPVDFAPDDPLLRHLERVGGAVDVDAIQLRSEGLRALQEAGVKLIVPLITQGKLIGTLNLGPRLSEQEYSSEDRRLLGDLAAQVAPAVRVAQLAQRQQTQARERERMVQELEVARLIQHTLLPKRLPELRGWKLAAHYQPARAVGGDFYDVVALPDGRVILIIGDVTDKGVPAALVMATTRAILRGAVRTLTSPGAILQRTNELLHPEIPPKMFVTCLCAVLHPASGRLIYANAGHDLPYRRCRDGVVELRATGMPLGLMPGMVYEEREVRLEPGDTVLFYSDGFVEAHEARRGMYGFGRLRQAIAAHPGGETLIAHLMASLVAFTGRHWEQEDDVTLLILRREPRPYADATAEDSSGVGEAVDRDAYRASTGPATAPWPLLSFTVTSVAGNERQAMERVGEVLFSSTLPWRPAAERLERLLTAVGEAVMNAIEHGNRGRAELPVAIRVFMGEHALVVRVVDAGAPGARTPLDLPDLDAKLADVQPARGWGVFLMRSMVDAVEETVEDGKHAVDLVVRRGEDAAP